MSVELVPHTGLNLVTKKTQTFEQYLVYEVHGSKREWVGIIGWAVGSKLIFMVPVDPIREQLIRDQVSMQLNREAELVSHPDLDEDQINPPSQETENEFNESDFT